MEDDLKKNEKWKTTSEKIENGRWPHGQNIGHYPHTSNSEQADPLHQVFHGQARHLTNNTNNLLDI